jgi:tRNA-2-methylthio-N6-dimethylallyladenosine synthase
MVHLRMKKSVFIYTYGCQMNVHDSEKILGTLEQSGYAAAASPDQADLIIFNTCAIRANAEQKFFSQLGRTKLLKNKKPKMKIAVAGCVAQDAKGRIFKRAPYVDFVLGPQNIHQVKDLLVNDKHLFVEDNPDIAFQEYEMNRKNGTRAWVSIMYGCNNYCSYCIVPSARGREVSRPSSSILAEIRDLKKKGYREVTLLGQNVNSYRSDMDFVQLLYEIDRTGMERVRFVTSNPRDLSPTLISAMAELQSVCEHLHLPLQSGSDGVLHAMNRKYTYDAYRTKVMMIRERIPQIAITTDIIVGFPGESCKDFEDTLKAIGELRFDGMFGFKYSKRKGTRACDMNDQVPEEVKTERINRVLKLQEGITLKRNRELEGTIQEILLEGPSDTDASMLMGRTRSNKIVTIDDHGEEEGTLMNVRIERARHHSLSARKLTS